MATFTGVFIEGSPGGAESLNLQLRQSFYNDSFLAEEATIYTGSADNVTDNCGDLTRNKENQFPNNYDGCKIQGYVDIFYNRVTATPNPIAVGNIVSDVTRELSIWNGYFTPTSLEQLLSLNSEGIYIDGPIPPVIMAPLEEFTYTLTIRVGEGPPTIDATYRFIFQADVGTLNVAVTGSRVLPLPYFFQAGLVENNGWKSKVLTSHNGYEQRLRLRNAPRQEFTFTIGIPRNQIAQLSSLMYGWRSNNFGLPITSEGRNLSSLATSGTTVLQVSTLYGDFRDGGLAMIYSSIDKFELLEIEAITDTTLTISSGIVNSYDISAILSPVRTARLLGDPVRNTSGDWQKLTAKFQSVENIVIPNTASTIQYKNLDVYLDEPLLVNGFIADMYRDRVDIVDYNVGLVDTFSPWLKVHTQRTIGIQMNSLEDVWTFRQWLNRRAGQFRPFWMPTFETDFTANDVGFITTQLIVLDEKQLGLTTERDDIAILLSDDSWVLAGIDSLEYYDADNLIITFDQSLNFLAEDIKLVCFLGRKRLTSDNIEIVWKGNNTAQASLPITEINN